MLGSGARLHTAHSRLLLQRRWRSGAITDYTNDILGLTQVLLADDGTTTTATLFGLDLIAQDDGSKTRTLLADGLGSARAEMSGRGGGNHYCHDPYGKLLAQTGSSLYDYGFTGEQEDAAAGLVYLRARYCNPSLRPLSPVITSPVGYAPASQHGYSYVHNNSVNNVDPTGEMCC
ncbi:MAG: RHS repeat-associated core domain-containing protein [Chloroflexota bacterium]